MEVVRNSASSVVKKCIWLVDVIWCFSLCCSQAAARLLSSSFADNCVKEKKVYVAPYHEYLHFPMLYCLATSCIAVQRGIVDTLEQHWNFNLNFVFMWLWRITVTRLAYANNTFLHLVAKQEIKQNKAQTLGYFRLLWIVFTITLSCWNNPFIYLIQNIPYKSKNFILLSSWCRYGFTSA